MAICRYCHKPFEEDGQQRGGKPLTGCHACRERRANRKHLVVYGYAVAHDEGNGQRPPPMCPVCGEQRAVQALCRCEREWTSEQMDADYQARYRGELPEFPIQL